MSLLTNLISYWKLDEASGNATDAHGSNTLTVAGSVGTGTGIINGARTFNGSNTWLTHADNTDLSTGNIDWSIAMWVNLASKTTYRVAAAHRDNTSWAWSLQYDQPSDRFVFILADGSSPLATAISTPLGSPSLNTWYHIVCWYDTGGPTANMTVNDGAVDLAGVGGTPADGTADWRIGGQAYPSAEFPWDGLLDECGFWKRVLTSGERTSLYNGGTGLAYPFSAPAGGLLLKRRRSA